MVQQGSEAPGLLYVEMDCPEEMEEEFHAWYNTEHVPERKRIPGFLRACRYTALVGSPRWLAIYELGGTDVLESRDYLNRYGSKQSPWTKRVTSKVRVHRKVYREEWGSTPSTQHQQDAHGLVAVRFATSQDEGAQITSWHDEEFAAELLRLPGVVSSRRYSCVEGGRTGEQLALYYLDSPWVTQQPEFLGIWDGGWDSRRDGLSLTARVIHLRILTE